MPETKDADKLDAQHVATQKAIRECACGNYVDAVTGESIGCEEETTRTFAPGHDAKLKSFLVQCYVQGHKVRKLGQRREVDGLTASREFGFSTQVAGAIQRQTEKARKTADMLEEMGGESRQTRSVFRNLQTPDKERDPWRPVGSELAAHNDLKGFISDAKAWLRDRSNLKTTTINGADWEAVYEWFSKH